MSHKENNKKDKEEKNTIICGILQRKIKPVLVLTIIFILLFSSSNILLASVVDDLIISIKNSNSYKELEQVNKNEENNQAESETTQQGKSEEREIQYTEEYLKWLNSSDEEKKAYGDVIPRKEFVPFNEDKEEYTEQRDDEEIEQENQNNNNESSNTTIVRNNKKTVALSESSSLPSRYRLNEHYDITVENQAGAGWCGAFSSLKSLETHLQVKGYYNPINKSNTKIKEDFSEWHMAFKAPGTGGALTTGGSFWSFYQYCGIYSTYGDVSKIEKARGPVLEDNITESVANIIKRGESNIPEEYLIYTNSLTPAYKVTKVKIFSEIYKKYNNGNVKYYSWDDQEIDNNNITEFRNDIKNHIVNYGGVYAVMGFGEDFSGYNSETNAVYTSDERWTHAVTIVGWDDNYSRYNFNEGNRPQNNGAYIALNSWGTDSGDNGYLYISYDDVNIEQDLNGVLEVQRYDQIPDYKITQERKDGKIEVSITSSQRLRFRGTPDANGYYSNEWKATAEAYEDVRFGAVLKAETVLKKTFNKTTTEEITFYDDFLKNKQTVTISVIDPMPPKINSITQSKELNGMLKFTVNASDDDSGIAGYSFDDGETWTVSNYKYIDSSENEVKIKVKDNAGNISSFNIKIRNSDNKPPELDKTFGNNGISYTLLAGNKNVKVTVKANEALKTIEDVSLGEEWIIDSTDNTKAYVTVDRNKQGKIKLVDLAGNKSEEIQINVNQIITSIGAQKTYKVNGQTLTEGAKTVGPVNAEIVVDMPINLVEDSKGDNEKNLWTIDYANNGETHLSKTYSNSSNGIFEEILTVQDKNNTSNTRKITIRVNIDKEKPTIQEVQDRVIEDDKVTIKLNTSEKVTIKESQGNWKLSEQDGKTILTKEFTENTQGEGEKIVVKDQVGNESEPYYVKIDNLGSNEEDDPNDPIVDPTDDEPILGDINLNGNIDGDDLLILKKYLLLGKQERPDWFVEIEKSKNADLDGNGNIGITDLLILKRKLDNSNKDN